MKHYHKGFTMLELLVTLAVIGIVMSIGVPMFSFTMKSNQLTTSINELATTMNMARSEAIKRNRHIIIRKKDPNWENGWTVFVDIDRSVAANVGAFNDDGDANLCEVDEDCLIKDYPALINGFSLRTQSNFTNFINYTSQGILSLASGASTAAVDNSFYLCNPISTTKPEIGTARVLVLNAIGRPRMAYNNKSIPQIIEGTDITTCSP